MKSKILRKLFGGLSLTTALFVFQACYGPPQDFGYDVLVEGLVKSKKTGLPVKGIKVTPANNPQYYLTGADGKFSFYIERTPDCLIRFEDPDLQLNGTFVTKDTTLVHPQYHIYFEISLQEI